MLRNYLAAALRNLSRNRLHAGINIIGLAIGFTVAILVGLYVRDELGYDRFIEGHRDVYRLTAVHWRDGKSETEDALSPDIASWLATNAPDVLAVARIAGADFTLRRGDVESSEKGFWADAEIFRVLPLRTLAGELDSALARPDGIVLTRSTARKYFGRDAPLGETLEVGGSNPMTVTAVIEDLPPDSHLSPSLFASSRAPFSRLAQLDAVPAGAQTFKPVVAYTYLRLKAGGRVSLQAIPDTECEGSDEQSCITAFRLQPLSQIHLHSNPPPDTWMRPPGSVTATQAILAIGGLVVFVASVNFVNLMTARAARRALEVGVRKASGATRRDLVLQFVGESLIHAVLAALLAMALVELLLPGFNAFLDRGIRFDYWSDPRLGAALAGLTLLVGSLAGFYPAFVLSAFRPVGVLRTAAATAAGSSGVRQALVTVQFAILTGLMLATHVIGAQAAYSIRKTLRMEQDTVLLLSTGQGGCDLSLKERIEALPGVSRAACTLNLPLGGNGIALPVARPDGVEVDLRQCGVDFDYFDIYGIRPLAGRVFSRRLGADAAPAERDAPAQIRVVLNETAVRDFGFASPQAAVEHAIPFVRLLSLNGDVSPIGRAEVIGVVPDFPTGSIRRVIRPTAFLIDYAVSTGMSLRLSGHDVPQTLRDIDRLWKATGHAGSLQPRFFDEAVQQTYLDVTRQERMLAASCAAALFIACLGLFGLSAFTAERRTREVGLRKALGAGSGDITRLLLRQFAMPAVWAAAIAWPAGYYLLERWLQGFAYRIALSAWMFLGATALALAIAWLTVLGHTLRVARGKPAMALRHE